MFPEMVLESGIGSAAARVCAERGDHPAGGLHGDRLGGVHAGGGGRLRGGPAGLPAAARRHGPSRVPRGLRLSLPAPLSAHFWRRECAARPVGLCSTPHRSGCHHHCDFGNRRESASMDVAAFIRFQAHSLDLRAASIQRLLGRLVSALGGVFVPPTKMERWVHLLLARGFRQDERALVRPRAVPPARPLPRPAGLLRAPLHLRGRPAAPRAALPALPAVVLSRGLFRSRAHFPAHLDRQLEVPPRALLPLPRLVPPLPLPPRRHPPFLCPLPMDGPRWRTLAVDD